MNYEIRKRKKRWQNASQGRQNKREEEVDVGGAAELLEEVERHEGDHGVLGRVRRVVAKLRVYLGRQMTQLVRLGRLVY